jgi:hypothetical protein
VLVVTYQEPVMMHTTGHRFPVVQTGHSRSRRDYVIEEELAVSPLDPGLGLPIENPPTVSERDQAAPSLAEALDRGLLPDYETSIALEATL